MVIKDMSDLAKAFSSTKQSSQWVANKKGNMVIAKEEFVFTVFCKGDRFNISVMNKSKGNEVRFLSSTFAEMDDAMLYVEETYL